MPSCCSPKLHTWTWRGTHFKCYAFSLKYSCYSTFVLKPEWFDCKTRNNVYMLLEWKWEARIAHSGFTWLQKFATFQKLQTFATFGKNKWMTKRRVQSSVKMCPQPWGGGGGGGKGGVILPVRTVTSQSKIIFFTELCFVCTGWCFLLVFMHFFHVRKR